MSNLNRLKTEFDAAKQSMANRNLSSCIRRFADLCKEMTDGTLLVTVDPDQSDEKNVCFVFEPAGAPKTFRSFVSVEYELNTFYMSGYYPVLIIRDPNNTTQRYSLMDHASLTRAVSPLRSFAARTMAREAVKEVCEQAWKNTFPSIP